MIEMLFFCGHCKGLYCLEIVSPLLYMLIRSFISALYLLNLKLDLPNSQSPIDDILVHACSPRIRQSGVSHLLNFKFFGSSP